MKKNNQRKRGFPHNAFEKSGAVLTRAFKEDICPFCHQYTIVSRHHVFGRTKTMRKFSEKYNAIIWPCWECHVTDKDSIHRNAIMRRQLKATHQERIMQEQGWDLDRWIKEVGENYLNENARVYY